VVVDCVPASAVLLLKRLIRVLCLGLSQVPGLDGELFTELHIAQSTLVHANDLEELVEDDIGDVDEHLVHQFGISG